MRVKYISRQRASNDTHISITSRCNALIENKSFHKLIYMHWIIKIETFDNFMNSENWFSKQTAQKIYMNWIACAKQFQLDYL